ncbi:hypothetical protein [Neobacillus sp. SuZ13]|uniref:hypothetical protein n=1 Tax=Neobacillus sp. SuZ13 TaxID=3047875 RepID=UPI0024BF2BE3|nr:hypothetical protein [Neobacillus sp. SuZ13]WHY69316.1 hypothetical protein QNH17_12025 [Neobacillus sp. SuZ13]
MTLEPSLLECLGAVLAIILGAVILLVLNLLGVPEDTKEAFADAICEAAQNC